MSQFYDLASLVVIPSGYKASTIYAQKPLTTDGQLSFTRASTATRVNASGLIEAVASNVPRLDYLGSTCPRLLLEPQRTNLSTYSEDFNAAGGLTYATVSSNTAVSPDGYTNADSFLDTTDNNIHAQIRSISKAASPVTYTHSLFIKAKDAGMKFQVSMDDAAIGGGDSGIFDPSTGTFVTAMGTPSAGYTNPSRSVTSYGNGWYRVSFTITTASATTNRYNIFLINASNATVYAGTGTGVYLYGAQLEAGAYATSYIPTLGASVTRVADDAYKGGISSLIGQSEGTVFLDYIITDNDGYRFIQLYNNEKDASAISVISLHSNAAEILAVCYRGNGTFDSISLTASGYSIGQRMKVAFRYKSGDFALYVNGIQKDIDSGSLTFIGTKAEINLADPDVYFAYKGGVLYNQFLQFKTGLTNAQLAELTTL